VAVDVDGAGAALARVAADVGAGELEVLPDELDEQASGLDVRLPSLTVDRERNMLGHQWSLLPLFGRWVAPGLRMRRGRCRRAVVKTPNAGTDASAVQAHTWCVADRQSPPRSEKRITDGTSTQNAARFARRSPRKGALVMHVADRLRARAIAR